MLKSIHKEPGVSPVISIILMIALVVILAGIVMIYSSDMFSNITKPTFIVPEIKENIIFGKNVITVLNLAGDTIYLNVNHMHTNKMGVYVDTTGGNYRAQPVPGVDQFSPGTWLFIYTTPDGYFITENPADIANPSVLSIPQGTVSVRLVDENSQMLIGTWNNAYISSPLPQPTPSPTGTPIPTLTNTITPTATATTNPTLTNTITPTATATINPTLTNTITPTATATSNPTLTVTPSPSLTLAPPPSIWKIKPTNARHGESIWPAFDIDGTGFQKGAVVRLSKANAPVIFGTNVHVMTSVYIWCDLEIPDAAIGNYDVIVTNPDGQSDTLREGFRVKK